VLFPAEKLMRTHPDENVQIAGRPAALSRLPFPGQAKAMAVIDTRRDFDLNGTLPPNRAHAAALRARRLHDLAFPATTLARLHVDEPAEGRLPDLAHLSAAAAVRTRSYGRSRLGLVAVTVVARL